MAVDMYHARLSADDFDTASIRSAAPSYVSEAPSYHSTAHPNECAPPYSPSARPPYSSTPRSMVPPASRSSTATHNAPARGLPRIPSPPRQSEPLQLTDFRVGTWSTVHSNPTYARVAHRRATAARHSNSTATVENALRHVLHRMNTEEANRVRPLEDPYLVGEEAAAKARRARLSRQNGDDILILEDMRWDRFLGTFATH
ncbi:uncharacterized protein B0I36DRAFT_345446 [Microdochium trichocladiopsis]|uniref:Uncharacterized protein n=1 Tax=Microdochium trichocladiopsis TaxID=1682393 RepID=A0A9P8YFX4_9PEZI|nr:uncharacterized protein B0I36DRAFT_345446 [Microdochium trichocladiopsis]KAH7037305.1 hypothetical protein B0I36DRAFT_345446 [Microdochium trichocladiopsis]